MPGMVMRATVLILVSLLTWFVVWYGRRFIEKRRKYAMSALPLERLPGVDGADTYSVRILAFSSEDCHQCHSLQAPALQRVLAARGRGVTVVEVDAPSSPELTRRYQVLTVPTTVVLDAVGHVHAVNYGFASTQRLLEQVDAAMALVTS